MSQYSRDGVNVGWEIRLEIGNQGWLLLIRMLEEAVADCAPNEGLTVDRAGPGTAGLVVRPTTTTHPHRWEKA